MTKLLFLTMFLIPVGAFAQVYDVQSTGEYVMGDSDTKVEARKMALNHAKQLAVEKIGTYIEAKTEVVNYQLTKDEITTYTSAIVKTSVISDNVRLLEDKTTVFTININASVDIGALSEKIKEVKNNSKREEQIKALQSENVNLKKELESVSALLKDGKNADIDSLRKQRDVLFERLDKNQSSMTVAFEKGTLLNLAMKNKIELSDIKSNADEFLQFIADNIKITVGDPQVKNNGKIADLHLDVTWNFKCNYDELQKEAKKRISGFPFYQYDMHSLDFKFSGINEKEIVKYWRDKSLMLNIKAGNFAKQIILKHRQKTEIEISSSKHVIISDIPINQLENITSIDAKLTIDEPQEITPLKNKGVIVPNSN